MPTMPKPAPLKRRSFITAAALSPAIAVAAVLGDEPTAPLQAAFKPEPPQPVESYHETEHIRRYYETAAF